MSDAAPPPVHAPHAAPPPYATTAPPPVSQVPAHKRRWFWPTVVGVVAFVLGAIAGGGGEAPTPSQVKASDEYAALAADLEAAQDELASAEAAADEARSAAAAAEAAIADLKAAAAAPAPEPVAPAVAPSAPAQPETFVMPDVVGANLQYAQDTLQSLGSYAMDQEDASGLGRVQVLDSNWQVCRQDPAPGTTVPVDTVITLAAVKLDETCP